MFSQACSNSDKITTDVANSLVTPSEKIDAVGVPIEPAPVSTDVSTQSPDHIPYEKLDRIEIPPSFPYFGKKPPKTCRMLMSKFWPKDNNGNLIRVKYFIEPFGGSAQMSIAVAKLNLADHIIINDKADNIVEIFKLLKSNGSYFNQEYLHRIALLDKFSNQEELNDEQQHNFKITANKIKALYQDNKEKEIKNVIRQFIPEMLTEDLKNIETNTKIINQLFTSKFRKKKIISIDHFLKKLSKLKNNSTQLIEETINCELMNVLKKELFFFIRNRINNKIAGKLAHPEYSHDSHIIDMAILISYAHDNIPQVNANGEYNCSIATKKNHNLFHNNIMKIANLLKNQNVTITNEDYDTVISQYLNLSECPGDDGRKKILLFMDPPYQKNDGSEECLYKCYSGTTFNFKEFQTNIEKYRPKAYEIITIGKTKASENSISNDLGSQLNKVDLAKTNNFFPQKRNTLIYSNINLEKTNQSIDDNTASVPARRIKRKAQPHSNQSIKVKKNKEMTNSNNSTSKIVSSITNAANTVTGQYVSTQRSKIDDAISKELVCPTCNATYHHLPPCPDHKRKSLTQASDGHCPSTQHTNSNKRPKLRYACFACNQLIPHTQLSSHSKSLSHKMKRETNSNKNYAMDITFTVNSDSHTLSYAENNQNATEEIMTETMDEKNTYETIAASNHTETLAATSNCDIPSFLQQPSVSLAKTPTLFNQDPPREKASIPLQTEQLRSSLPSFN